MSPPTVYRTPPYKGKLSEQDEKGLSLAIQEAKEGFENEGGIPIGACLINNTTGKVLGTGRNLRVQQGNPILHGETSCLQNIGRLPASVYVECTIYTTLSPCTMCTGAALLFGIKRIVMGENETFSAAEDWLREKGVEVINVDSQQCKDLMAAFIQKYPDVWNEDIGE